MSWEAPFIVYRLDSDGKLSEVYHASDLKSAKYWLSYIAEPGDMLARTPAHPRHDSQEPAYWSHKEPGGKASSQKDEWYQQAKKQNWDERFPEEQAVFENQA